MDAKLLRLFSIFCISVAMFQGCIEDKEGNRNIRGIRIVGARDINSPGEVLKLKAVPEPAGEIPESITWTASPADIAKIDANTGVLTPLKNGSVRVSVLCPKEAVSATVVIKITRQAVPAEYISIYGAKPITEPGGVIQLEMRIEPEGAIAPKVIWEVDNPRIATISKTGKLSAHDNGTVIVFLKSVNDEGNHTLLDQKTITVSNQDLPGMFAHKWKFDSMVKGNFSGFNDEADPAVMDMLEKVIPIYYGDEYIYERNGNLKLIQENNTFENLSFSAYSDTLEIYFDEYKLLTAKVSFTGENMLMTIPKESIRRLLLITFELHEAGYPTIIDSLFDEATLESLGVSVMGLNVSGIFFPQMLTEKFLMDRFSNSLKEQAILFELVLSFTKEE